MSARSHGLVAAALFTWASGTVDAGLQASRETPSIGLGGLGYILLAALVAAVGVAFLAPALVAYQRYGWPPRALAAPWAWVAVGALAGAGCAAAGVGFGSDLTAPTFALAAATGALAGDAVGGLVGRPLAQGPIP